MIALDELGVKPGIGSVRGVPGFKIHEALAACTHLLVSHGGHAAAGGLKIEDGNVDAFREDFCEFAARQICEADRVAELWIDGETHSGSLTHFAPWSKSNAWRPSAKAIIDRCCALRQCSWRSRPSASATGRHLSLRLDQHGVAAARRGVRRRRLGR